MGVIRSRQETVGAGRMLTDRKPIVAEQAMGQFSDVLENLGAPDLEQRGRWSRVDAARHLRDDTKLGRLERQHVEFDAGDLPNKLAMRGIALINLCFHDSLQAIEMSR